MTWMELDVLKALTFLHGKWSAIEKWSHILANSKKANEEFERRFKKEVEAGEMTPIKLQRLFQVLMVPDERIALEEMHDHEP